MHIRYVDRVWPAKGISDRIQHRQSGGMCTQRAPQWLRGWGGKQASAQLVEQRKAAPCCGHRARELVAAQVSVAAAYCCCYYCCCYYYNEYCQQDSKSLVRSELVKRGAAVRVSSAVETSRPAAAQVREHGSGVRTESLDWSGCSRTRAAFPTGGCRRDRHSQGSFWHSRRPEASPKAGCR